MSLRALRASWYRTQVTVRQRWGGYVGLTLLVALVGGLAMGSIASARRTQSSFGTFFSSTNPSNLTIVTFPSSPVRAYSAPLERTVERFGDVASVESAAAPLGIPLAASGAPRLDTSGQVTPIMSVTGLYFDQDRPGVISGRMADPRKADEFVTTAEGARLLDWHVGEVIPFGFYSGAQFTSPGFGTPAVQPVVRLEAKLVGLVTFNTGVVQDDVDTLPTFALFTPALAKSLLAHPGATTGAASYGLRLVRGNRDVGTAEAQFQAALGRGMLPQYHVATAVVARANRAIKPESIALGVFGGIAALATLAIAAQAIARQVRTQEGDLEILRALGADPATTMSDGLLGVLGALVVGGLLAVGIAVALSPLSPLGPVRAVYPARGFAADWTVLGPGLVVLIGVLGAVAIAITYRAAPHRRAGRGQLAPTRRSLVAGAAAASGLPAPGIAGIRFALERGSGRSAVPVRSALSGMALAVIVVSATLTFGSSLATLVSRPALYGWGWSYALGSFNGPDVPPQAVALLGHDPMVAAYSDASIADPTIDNLVVPSIFEAAGAPVTPPLLSGHQLRANDEIVLGAATMKELHTHVGGTVTASYGSPKSAPVYVPPLKLRVVGTATMPALGFPSSEGDHTSMGTGALLPTGMVPAALRNALNTPYPTLNGPEFVFVRMRAGLSAAAARRDIDRIAAVGNRAFATAPHGVGAGATVTVLSVLRPAEIVNYRSTGETPILLAGSLALGAVVALGLTLVASVRRRRRDLALLKALGFTQSQLSASVAMQATVVAVIGLLVGLPLGIALGRWFWILFAEQIYAVPEPTVPALSLLLVALGALLLVNVVAALPGRAAARTPTALVLRAE